MVKSVHNLPKTRDCIEWSGGTNGHGYGRLKINGKSVGAHRYSYECNVGEIPEGCMVLHRCDNRLCINPDHLFVGSHQDNMDDMVNKGRATGPKMHKRKHTDSEIISICESFTGRRGEFSEKAEELGVDRRTIYEYRKFYEGIRRMRCSGPSWMCYSKENNKD